MLDLVAHDNGLITYQSPLLGALGVRHAFSTRVGGVSRGDFASLNLAGLTKGDGDANTSVAENFRRLRKAVGLERLPRDAPRQVHGRGVWTVEGPPTRPGDAPEADAAVTAEPGRLLVIRTADCVPILLASADGRVVAAVHAGWRGVIAGVVPAAVSRLREVAGGDAVVAAIGPCISAAHFEVGPEVAERFAAAGLASGVISHGSSNPHVDLREAVLRQLQHQGLDPAAIDTTDRCTYRDADKFFSHRRDVTHHGQGHTGRMAGVITPR